jgi:hypothetical protein
MSLFPPPKQQLYRRGVASWNRYHKMNDRNTWNEEQFQRDFRNHVLVGQRLGGPITDIEPNAYIGEVLHQRLNMVSTNLAYANDLLQQVCISFHEVFIVPIYHPRHMHDL